MLRSTGTDRSVIATEVSEIAVQNVVKPRR